jgi:hypothetical protein
MNSTDSFLEGLQKISDWQHQYLGRQCMQTAVLTWAVENKEALRRADLVDSLIAAMDSELALHNAAKPSA